MGYACDVKIKKRRFYLAVFKCPSSNAEADYNSPLSLPNPRNVRYECHSFNTHPVPLSSPIRSHNSSTSVGHFVGTFCSFILSLFHLRNIGFPPRPDFSYIASFSGELLDSLIGELQSCWGSLSFYSGPGLPFYPTHIQPLFLRGLSSDLKLLKGYLAYFANSYYFLASCVYF